MDVMFVRREILCVKFVQYRHYANILKTLTMEKLKILYKNNSKISNAKLHQAMIGNHVTFDGMFTEISLGDYTEMI